VVAAPDDVLFRFGAARMTETLVEAKGIPCTLRAFRDWNEAEQWLRKADPAPT
jgi:hypothetical protein